MESDIHVYGHTHIGFDAVPQRSCPTATAASGLGHEGGEHEPPRGPTGGHGTRRYVHHPLDGAARPSLYCIWSGQDLVGIEEVIE